MKTTILILNTSDWEMETKTGKLAGTSAKFLMEEMDKVHSSTIKEEFLELVTATKLPATFEVDIAPKMSTFDGKSSLKFTINSLKLVREMPIFSNEEPTFLKKF